MKLERDEKIRVIYLARAWVDNTAKHGMECSVTGSWSPQNKATPPNPSPYMHEVSSLRGDGLGDELISGDDFVLGFLLTGAQ